MSVSGVHACFELIAKNEKLKRHLQKLVRENKDLKERLRNTQEQEKLKTVLKLCSNRRCVETQTEQPARGRCTAVDRGLARSGSQLPHSLSRTDRRAQADDLNAQLTKLAAQHANLLGLYNREGQLSLKLVEENSLLTMKILELEHKLANRSQNELKHLCTQSETLNQMDNGICRHKEKSKTTNPTFELAKLKAELNCLRSEKNKLERLNKSLRSELRSLDPVFFEEIEDLKFALHQSALLNKEYEKVLRRICLQFGLPYPNPEKHFLPG